MAVVTPFGPIPAKRSVLCVLGPPGAGKTTLSLRLAEAIRAELVVMSRFLRELREKKAGSSLARYIGQNFANGTNVDDPEIHLELLDQLNKMESSTIILDGFPRTQNAKDQLLRWVTEEECGLMVVHVFADMRTCRKRFMSKNYDTGAEAAFERRADHYASVERQLISSSLSENILNINTAN